MIKDNFFPHDLHAISDEKIEFAIAKFGLVAYGVYWLLIEKMHKSETGELNKIYLETISICYNIDITLLLQIYNTFISVNLFEISAENENFYFSKRVKKNKLFIQELKEKKSSAGKIGMMKRWNKSNSITDVITENNTTITDENNGITKHNKLNKTKLNKTKYIIKENKEKIFELIFSDLKDELKNNSEFLENLKLYIQNRIDKRSAVTESIAPKIAKKLNSFKNPVKAIENSVDSGYSGIYDAPASAKSTFIPASGIDYDKPQTF